MAADRRRRRRGPGHRAGLTAARVLAAARAVSVDEGVAALTMRRLATALGVAPNAIYSHFADKSALLDALIDGLLVEVPLPDLDSADWRRGLFDLMNASRHLLLAHADLIPIFLAAPTRGPNAIRLGEVTLALLGRAGLRGAAAVDALRILLVYSFGFAAQEAPRRAEPDPDRRRALGEAALRQASGLPLMQRHARHLVEHPGDRTFAIGLEWLLDGIAAAAARE